MKTTKYIIKYQSPTGRVMTAQKWIEASVQEFIVNMTKRGYSNFKVTTRQAVRPDPIEY